MFTKVLIIVTFSIATAFPTLSFSHAKVTQTYPANEAVLNVAPEKITLSFPEALQITSFKLEDVNGNSIPVQDGKSLSPTNEINATPPKLPQGIYNVFWRGLSSDGHPTKGHFSFTIAP